jgi:hypothetical protein
VDGDSCGARCIEVTRQVDAADDEKHRRDSHIPESCGAPAAHGQGRAPAHGHDRQSDVPDICDKQGPDVRPHDFDLRRRVEDEDAEQAKQQVGVAELARDQARAGILGHDVVEHDLGHRFGVELCGQLRGDEVRGRQRGGYESENAAGPRSVGGSDAIAVHLQADRLQLSEDDARDWREKLSHFVVGYGSVVGIDLNCRLE